MQTRMFDSNGWPLTTGNENNLPHSRDSTSAITMMLSLTVLSCLLGLVGPQELEKEHMADCQKHIIARK